MFKLLTSLLGAHLWEINLGLSFKMEFEKGQLSSVNPIAAVDDKYIK